MQERRSSPPGEPGGFTPRKKGSEVSAFEKALDQAVGEKAEIKSLVSKRSLEVRDLDETVTREEVIAALCITLGKPDLGKQCRLYKRFGGVQTAVVHLTEADAWSHVRRFPAHGPTCWNEHHRLRG